MLSFRCSLYAESAVCSNVSTMLTPWFTVQLVVSDKPGCGGWQYAEQHGIATLHYNPKDKNSPSAAQVVEHLQTAEIEYIALAGYLKVCVNVWILSSSSLPASTGQRRVNEYVHILSSLDDIVSLSSSVGLSPWSCLMQPAAQRHGLT